MWEPRSRSGEAASSSTAAAPVYTSHESVAALTVDPQGHSGSDVAAQGSLPDCFFGPARDNFFFDDVAVGVPHAAHPTVLSGDQEDTDIPIPDPSSSSSAPMPASHEEILICKRHSWAAWAASLQRSSPMSWTF